MAGINSVAGYNTNISSANENVQAKKKFSMANPIKGYNTATGWAVGGTKSAACGLAAGGLTAIIGKNIKNADGKILGTLTGIGKDLAGSVVNIAKKIPSLVTKSPLENLKGIANIPKNAAKYLKGSGKLVTGIALAAGIGVATIGLLKNRFDINQKNADVDHKFGIGHNY